VRRRACRPPPPWSAASVEIHAYLKIEYSTFEINVLAFKNMWCLPYINTPHIFHQSILQVINKGEVVHIYDWSV
jgi:hypothetical protein